MELEYDPFLGSDDTQEDYHLSKIYTRSTNRADHSANIQLPLRKEHHAHLVRLSNDDTYPEYTSPQAVVRDAIHHRLYYLSTHKEDFETLAMLSATRAMDEMGARDDRRRSEREFIDSQAQELGKLQQDMDWDELQVKVMRLRDILEAKSFFPGNERHLRSVLQNADATLERLNR